MVYSGGTLNIGYHLYRLPILEFPFLDTENEERGCQDFVNGRRRIGVAAKFRDDTGLHIHDLCSGTTEE